MYIIIAGGGTIGSEVVKNLTGKKVDVVLIDRDKEICDDIYAAYGIETIAGNATRIQILKAAGIEKADMVISTLRDDADNLAVSVLAKSFSIKEIVVLMKKKSYYEAYKTVGVTRILNIVDILVLDILNQIEKPKVRKIADLGSGAVEIFIIRIPEDGKVVGKTISEVASNQEMPQESIIAGIYKEDEEEFVVPRGNIKLSGGSDLFVITKPELVAPTAKYLMRS